MPASQELPDPDHDMGERELLAFERRVLKVAGRYTLGGDAVVYDPAWTGVPYLPALIAHEQTHEKLTTNTSFGFFTQLLGIVTKRNLAGSPMVRCERAQWKVQELAATYSELAEFAIHRPELLAGEIDRLPAGRRGEPPYREAFDLISARLPLTTTMDRYTIEAMSWLVLALAFLAMSTDCLRRASQVTPSEASLLGCMIDEPGDRLQRLLEFIDATSSWSRLVEHIRTLVKVQGEKLNLALVLEPLYAVTPASVYLELEDLRSLAKPIFAAWGRALNAASVLYRDEHSLKFGFSPELADQINRRNPRTLLSKGSIAAFVRAAARNGQGFILELALRWAPKRTRQARGVSP